MTFTWLYYSRFWLVGLLILGLLQGCTLWSQAGGSGADETTNAPSFALLDSNGEPIKGALGIVRPAQYRSVQHGSGFANCDGCWTGISDSHGRFTMDSLPIGDYRLEVRATDGGRIKDFSVTAQGNDISRDSLLLNVAPYASWSGSVELPAGLPYARIVLEGLDRIVYTDSQGNFIFDQVPAGEYTLWVYLPDTVQAIASYTQTLVEGDTLQNTVVTIEEPQLSEWTYSMEVSLDTRDAEMQLSGIVQNFTMLLWLDGEDFPFEAQEGGADLRVLDHQGNLLPFYISLWDRQAGLAQVWVRFESIYPDDSLKIAEIRWGQALARPMSNSYAVFDTSLGWRGVWDLVQKKLGDQNRWYTPDLTAYGNHGMAGELSGNSATFSAAGAYFHAGQAQEIVIGGVPIDFGRDTFSIELWVVPQDTCGVMLAKRSPDSTLLKLGEKRFYLSNTFPRWEVSDGNMQYSSNSLWDAPLQNWNHTILVGRPNPSRDSTILTWYMHGNPAPANPLVVPMFADNALDSIYLAASSMSEPRYAGTLSHLRIVRRALSADWVRLSQRTEWRNNPFVKYSR